MTKLPGPVSTAVLGAALLAAFGVGCTTGSGNQQADPKQQAQAPGVQQPAEVLASGLSPTAPDGFLAESSTRVELDRGEGPVVIHDEASMNLAAGGDFSFRRVRKLSGSPEGPSEESVAAIRRSGQYFTAASSGIWVRWDDELDQPASQIARFISDEEAVLTIAGQCGRFDDEAQPDGRIRRRVQPVSTSCRFESGSSAGIGTGWSGTIRDLSGEIEAEGRFIRKASLKMSFDSTIDGVAAAVRVEYVLNASPAGDPEKIAAPAEFRESRRPRPIRMVESVLDGIADQWGPGAPESLRQKQPAKGR